MSELETLFTKYGTDKGIWGYTPAYEEHLEPIRKQAKQVLEIGICGFRDIPNNVVGASLFAWRDYFPNAMIHGIDNDGQFIFNDQHRIATALADAYDAPRLDDALVKLAQGPYDFICDDAVHDPVPQLHLFGMLWPLLRVGGIYAIEEACPYKVHGGNLTPMVGIINMMTGMRADVTEYKTHKPEQLLIIKKLA